MKKTIVLIICVLLSGAAAFTAPADTGRFTVQAQASLLLPADEQYKTVYGDSVFSPGFRLGYAVTNPVYLWLGYDFINKNGTTVELGEEATSNQHFFGIGAGWQGVISERFGYRLQAGVLFISWKEEALEEEVSDSAFGFDLEGNLLAFLSQNVYGMLFAGYRTGSDTYEDVDITFGGFKIGVGLGLRF